MVEETEEPPIMKGYSQKCVESYSSSSLTSFLRVAPFYTKHAMLYIDSYRYYFPTMNFWETSIAESQPFWDAINASQKIRQIKLKLG
jgi:hypothetical protein